MVLYCDVVYRLEMDITRMETLAIQEYCPPLDVWRGLNWRVRVVVLAEAIPEVTEMPFPTTTLVPFFNHITCGTTTSPFTTITVHVSVYGLPAVELPDGVMVT